MKKRSEAEVSYDITSFLPNGKQKEFIKLVGEGNHFISILSAGNGVGKTAVVVNVLKNIIWGKQSQFFDYGLYKEWPFPKRIRIVTESKNVTEIGAIDQEIKAWWPKGKYKGFKSGKQFVERYETDNGWIIDKMSYEQELTEFESSTLGLVWFDEPPPKPIFDASKWRLRKGGLVLISMTPLEGAAWIFEEGGLQDSEDCAIIYADIEDNCKEHGGSDYDGRTFGILEHKHIEMILKDASPSEIEARKSGKPLHAINTILGDVWDPDVHIIGDDVEPQPGSQFGMTIDPADGKPYAIGWWWVNLRGEIVFDYNWPEENWVVILKKNLFRTLKMDDYDKIFKNYEKGRVMDWQIMDRHYDNNEGVRTISLIDDWNRPPYNRNFVPSYKTGEEVDTGIKKMKDYLKFDKTQPINAMNAPRIYVKKRCKNIIMSLPKWANKVDPETYISKPDTKSVYKDFCDVVRYTVMAKPQVYISRPFTQPSVPYVLGR